MFEGCIKGQEDVLPYLNDMLEEKEVSKLEEINVCICQTKYLRDADAFYDVLFRDYVKQVVLNVPFVSLQRAVSFIEQFYKDYPVNQGLAVGLSVPEIYYNYYLTDKYLAYIKLKEIFRYLGSSFNKFIKKINDNEYECDFYNYKKELSGYWSKELLPKYRLT